LKDYEERAKSGNVDILDYAERLSALHKKVMLSKGLELIDKQEKELKNFSGAEQKELERMIAEDKKSWLKLYREVLFSE
jgi:hypothetical protein